NTKKEAVNKNDFSFFHSPIELRVKENPSSVGSMAYDRDLPLFSVVKTANGSPIALRSFFL
ncbi:hypothetical protein, partial [uncultured Dialister sp.]|uniref:hypothetical protein n=1 Tax=uncultured Dialister sp. TaxID=278064 RepID=UPI0027DBA6EF